MELLAEAEDQGTAGQIGYCAGQGQAGFGRPSDAYYSTIDYTADDAAAPSMRAGERGVGARGWAHTSDSGDGMAPRGALLVLRVQLERAKANEVWVIPETDTVPEACRGDRTGLFSSAPAPPRSQWLGRQPP